MQFQYYLFFAGVRQGLDTGLWQPVLLGLAEPRVLQFHGSLQWVVLSIVVRLSFSRRPWALPVLMALYWSRKWNQNHGKTHRTPPEILESLVKVLMRWFPDRCFRLSADGGFGTHRIARFSSRNQDKLGFVSRFYPDANLYEACPVTGVKKNGRPRIKGSKALSPEQVVEQAEERTRMIVNWYGGEKREVEIVSSVGHWFKQGHGFVAIRCVFVHDLSGTHRDEYFFTTRIHMPPRYIIEAYTERWSIEVTFEEARAYLGFGTTRCHTENAVLREAPFLLWLYSIVELLYVMLPTGKQARIFIRWQGKNAITFSDVITGLRRWLWVNWAFATAHKKKGFQKLSRPFQDMLLGALAPAA